VIDTKFFHVVIVILSYWYSYWVW